MWAWACIFVRPADLSASSIAYFICIWWGNLYVTRFFFHFDFLSRVFFCRCILCNYVSFSPYNSKLTYAYHSFVRFFYLQWIVEAMQISNQRRAFISFAISFFSLSLQLMPILFRVNFCNIYQWLLVILVLILLLQLIFMFWW